MMSSLLKRIWAVALLSLLALTAAVLLYLRPWEGTSLHGFQLHMIDVGQAEAILLTCDGQSALIDAGTQENGDRVVEYIKNLGIDSLDYAIITHTHSDHMGGMEQVFEHLSPDISVRPDYSEHSYALDLFDGYASASGAQTMTLQVGDNIALGEASISVLWPSDNVFDEDLNETSLILLIEYDGTSMLLTGDAGARSESEILQLVGDVDLLKVGHHGSDTSTSDEFLQACSPELALISCGAGNSYGHPHTPVLERLNDHGAVIYRTDTHGDITVIVTGGQIDIKTAR